MCRCRISSRRRQPCIFRQYIVCTPRSRSRNCRSGIRGAVGWGRTGNKEDMWPGMLQVFGVCVYIHIHLHMCVCACVCVCVHLYVYRCVCARVRIRGSVCVLVYVDVCTPVYRYRLDVCVYACVCWAVGHVGVLSYAYVIQTFVQRCKTTMQREG